MRVQDDDQRKYVREHRYLKDCRYKLHCCELQLSAEIELRSHLQALLREAVSKKFIDQYKATPEWLNAVQAACPAVIGERR
jgi:hypothetical protein